MIPVGTQWSDMSICCGIGWLLSEVRSDPDWCQDVHIRWKSGVKDSQENLQINNSQVAGQRKQLNRNYTDRNTQRVKSSHAQQTRQKNSAGANEMNVAQIRGILHLQENLEIWSTAQPQPVSSAMCGCLLIPSLPTLLYNRFMVA